MTNMGGASSSGGAVSGLLARSQRPAVVPGRMPFAHALPSIEERVRETVAEPVAVNPPQPTHVDVRVAQPVSTMADSPSAVPPRRDDSGPSEATVVRSLRAPAPVEVEPATAPTTRVALEAAEPEPTLIHARTDAPDKPAPATRPFPAIAPRLVDAAPHQARGAEELLQANPLPLLATLTERATREPVEASVELVVLDRTEPSAANTSTEIAGQPTDREPTNVVAAARPVPVVDRTPPVTIGEIHVHVAAPAEAGPDPLALLAPWANGLTARRTASV
jgi:hypothetical protein